MKIIFITMFFPVISLAGTFEIIGPCSAEPVFTAEVSSMVGKSVGELTVQTLTDFSIPFLGNEVGIHSIFNTPTGEDAYEILSKTEMRAYGWCYSVDGIEPKAYPSEVTLTSETSHVSWYFGFAHYRGGEWLTQCTKSYTVKSEFVCPQKESVKSIR